MPLHAKLSDALSKDNSMWLSLLHFSLSDTTHFHAVVVALSGS